MAKKRKPVNHRYNEAMIRDFLDHLEWECRICHAENTHMKGKLSEELGDALARYFKKRGSVLMLTNVWPDDVSDDVGEAYHEIQRQRMEKALAALNTLRPIFEEALKCIEVMRATGAVPMRQITPERIDGFLDSLRGSESGEAA